MATAAGARPLPKFGEWDMNQAGGDQGFTVIFNKARNQKKTSGSAVSGSLNGGSAPKQNAAGDGVIEKPAGVPPPPPPPYAMQREHHQNQHGHGHVHGQGYGHVHGPNSHGQGRGHAHPHLISAAGYYDSNPNRGQRPNQPQKNRWLCCIYGSET